MNVDALGYTVALGLPLLRQKIAELYKNWYNIDLNPDRVVVTPGASGGFLLAFTSLFESGSKVGIASPDDFSSLVAIYLIVGLVVGGVGTLEGAVIGGLIYALVPDWASSTQSIAFVPERWLQGPTGSLILGIMLILLTLFMPGGMATALKKIKS